ncbi:MAG: ABC transporter permease [Clostridium sp.]|nr:ABC transporter permease [Clostridium sp.]MCM1443958.1 ABC transporter permease [Candidatus Amulumruptor caecigallinarius]
MTVFKTFWNIVNKYKFTIIIYTSCLIVFAAINMQSSDTQIDFTDSLPSVYIVNNDTDNKVTNNLVKYIEENSDIVDLKNDEKSINDAIFYRDAHYVIYIPKNYGSDIMNGLNPTIDIKSSGTYQSSLAEMLLTRYIKIQNIYKSKIDNEEELINSINNNIIKTANIEIASKLDINKTSNMAFFFNFASYSNMAIIIFIICLVLASFKEINISKRIIISSMDYKKHNRNLLISSFTFGIIIWILLFILSIIFLGTEVFTPHGIIYLINLFIFTFCSLTLAILISTIVKNKNAVNGIVNVVALGSAFLCGAFVPAEFIPESVLNIAHILPMYWYINSNDLLKTIEVLNINTLSPIIINSIVLISFSILFIIINNVISKHKRTIA